MRHSTYTEHRLLSFQEAGPKDPDAVSDEPHLENLTKGFAARRLQADRAAQERNAAAQIREDSERSARLQAHIDTLQACASVLPRAGGRDLEHAVDVLQRARNEPVDAADKASLQASLLALNKRYGVRLREQRESRYRNVWEFTEDRDHEQSWRIGRYTTPFRLGPDDLRIHPDDFTLERNPKDRSRITLTTDLPFEYVVDGKTVGTHASPRRGEPPPLLPFPDTDAILADVRVKAAPVPANSGAEPQPRVSPDTGAAELPAEPQPRIAPGIVATDLAATAGRKAATTAETLRTEAIDLEQRRIIDEVMNFMRKEAGEQNMKALCLEANEALEKMTPAGRRVVLLNLQSGVYGLLGKNEAPKATFNAASGRFEVVETVAARKLREGRQVIESMRARGFTVEDLGGNIFKIDSEPKGVTHFYRFSGARWELADATANGPGPFTPLRDKNQAQTGLTIQDPRAVFLVQRESELNRSVTDALRIINGVERD